MIIPCPKHVLCPEGTGVQSEGINYSAERPYGNPFWGNPFPPTTPYGTFTSCRGLCISNISQQDADLCAQRNAAICVIKNNPTPPGGPGGNPRVFTNTIQICQEKGTGRLVIVPAGTFVADSQADADAQALAYANKQQKDPGTPPGITTVPNDGTPVLPNIPTPIPGPTQPPPPKPPTPPTSQCKPCDDTHAVDTFAFTGGVAAGTSYLAFDTFPLKCGTWKITVTGGLYPVGTPGCTINMGLFIPDDPDPQKWTPLSWSEFLACPQPAWVCPCAADTDCLVADVQQFALFPGCCGVSEVVCSATQCYQGASANYLMVMRFEYVCEVDSPPARNFSITGVLQP